jgi:hypothetical protein
VESKNGCEKLLSETKNKNVTQRPDTQSKKRSAHEENWLCKFTRSRVFEPTPDQAQALLLLLRANQEHIAQGNLHFADRYPHSKAQW